MSPVEWIAVICMVSFGAGMLFATYLKPDRDRQKNYAQISIGTLIAFVPVAAYWMESDEWSEFRFGTILSLAILFTIGLAMEAGKWLHRPEPGSKFRTSVPGKNVTLQNRSGYHNFDK